LDSQRFPGGGIFVSRLFGFLRVSPRQSTPDFEDSTMKYACALLLILFAASVQAQLIVPKGSKASLKVTYQFKSDGKVEASSKDRKANWRALRVVEITGQYVAEAPQPFSALRQDDTRNKQNMAALQTKVEAAHKTLQPTMNDMMKIVEKCNDDEACITREVQAYGNQMDPATINTGKEQVGAVTQMATAQRYQMWKQVSQTGTYRIDEEVTKQVYEMTCDDVRVCKSVEIRKGAGDIAPPAGKPSGGASFLEVDSANKDLLALLPLPLTPMTYTSTINTTIPDEKSGTSKQVSPPWMMKGSKPNPAAIAGDFKLVSGTQTYKVEGAEDQGGTLTVSWTFTRL
jgi:hypothetical protein